MDRLWVENFELVDEVRGGYVINFELGVFICKEVWRVGFGMIDFEGGDGIEYKVLL